MSDVCASLGCCIVAKWESGCSLVASYTMNHFTNGLEPLSLSAGRRFSNNPADDISQHSGDW